jgi:chromosome segregation protein
MPDIYGLILETLRRHLGTRAEAVLEEGLKRLGKRQEELSPKDGETLLKGLAFRELQARLPAKEAKRVVEEALKKLSAPSEPVDLEALEAGLKRFGLYLDWPEVARYRALVNRLRQDPDPRLMREAKALLEALEEKLEEALLRQAKDLAHLEESLERVRHLGGPKVRRLEKLVETVRGAQKEGLLAQAEVERARSLALELRKLLESSVARPPTLPEIVFETLEEPPEDVFLTVEEAEELEGELIVDLEALPEEAARRLEALEVEEEGRRLEELLARHAHLLQEPTVSPLLAEVQALLEAGKPAGEKLSLLEAALKEAEANLRAEKKARLIQLEARLRSLPLPEEAKASLEAAFALAEETLREGGLPDLKLLEGELARLEAEARRQEEEKRKLEEEREALARELAAKGEAFAPLLEELRAVPLEALPQRLPEIKARYAALLMTQGEEAALKAKLKEAEEELKALRPEALALGLWESLEKAEEALAKGELPDLAALRREVAQAREAARREALEELSRMEALAERFLGFGGEGVLRLIAEEKAKPLPDPTPVARALQALKRRLEAKREEVLTRLTAFFQAYGGLEGFQSETHRRLRPLLQFLQSAKERLPRLGPKGLAQVEKTLAEAEDLLEELKREAEAAKSILKEIQGADLEALLGVFEEKPPLDLDRFRLPGVEALGFLEESPPLPKEALQELKRALEPLRGLFQEEGPVALLLGRKALVLAPFSGKTLVALMEPGALSAFLLKLSS